MKNLLFLLSFSHQTGRKFQSGFHLNLCNIAAEHSSIITPLSLQSRLYFEREGGERPFPLDTLK